MRVTFIQQYKYNNIKYNFTAVKKSTLLIIIFFAGLYLDASEDRCSLFQENWKSEKEAVKYIENTTFLSSESLTPNENSWVTSVRFYTCNEESGYLIIKSINKTFVHQEVPMDIWNALKKTRTTGGYYNFYIKNNYKLEKKGAKSVVL